MVYTGIERRKQPRLAVKFPVRFKIKNGQDNQDVFEATGRDISAGGICMEMILLAKDIMEKVFRSSGKLELEIDIPDMGHTIKASGEIVWMRKEQNNDILGIFFKDISEEEKNSLSNYVKQRT